MKHSRFVLTGLLLLHAGLGLLFNLATPIFEAPDEDGHYLFIRYLQVYQQLPVQNLDANGPRAHHPPLYHLLGALLTAWVPVRGGADRIDAQPNPKVYFRYDDPALDNKNMWIHYGPEERWPYSGQALVVHLVRGLSLVFSTLGVWLTWRLTRELRPGDDALASLVTSLVGLNPMLLFMAGVLQNNTTMLATGAGVLYLVSVIVQRGLGRQMKYWLALGLVLGVGILLQLSSFVLAAPVGLALLYEAWRQRRWQTLVLGGLAVAGPVVALTGWWIARNLQIYGDWSGNNVVAAMWCCDPIPPLRALRLFVTGLLGRFGQGLMITYPQPVYITAGLLALVALAGHMRPDLAAGRLGLVGPLPLPDARRGSAVTRDFWRFAWLTPTVVLWLAHVGTILAVSGALLFYAIRVAPGLPGRYMFPAFPSLALVLATGWLAWFRPRRRAMGVVFLGGLTAAAALYALFGMVIPTYTMPRSPSAAELRAMTPVDARIEDTARVLGYRLSHPTARPGDTVTLAVYWEPLARTDVPYTVFLHVLEPGVGSVAQRDTYPGLGNYATTVWDVGRPFVDTYTLALPPEAAGEAQLLFGLYNGETGLRLPVTGRDAGSADESWVRLGSLTITP